MTAERGGKGLKSDKSIVNCQQWTSGGARRSKLEERKLFSRYYGRNRSIFKSLGNEIVSIEFLALDGKKEFAGT